MKTLIALIILTSPAFAADAPRKPICQPLYFRLVPEGEGPPLQPVPRSKCRDPDIQRHLNVPNRDFPTHWPRTILQHL